ncbi:MAG TPA: hypothetical protein VFA33_26535 [Bryobacteraceae bacterium]|nr:hypothetical protein [Bryobacteraceae bacterium]
MTRGGECEHGRDRPGNSPRGAIAGHSAIGLQLRGQIDERIVFGRRGISRAARNRIDPVLASGAEEDAMADEMSIA